MTNTRSAIYFWRQFGFILALLACIMSACTKQRAEIATDIEVSRIKSHEGFYGTPVWISDNRIAFVFSPSLLHAATENRIVIYDLGLDTWHELPLPMHDSACSTQWIEGPIRPLPEEELGFLVRCNLQETSSFRYSLNGQNLLTGQTHKIIQYPDGFAASWYSSDTTGSKLIQERAIGAGSSSRLYRVSPPDHVIDFLPEFERAAAPSWSPTGEVLAFMGTKDHPGSSASPRSFQFVEDYLSYPWDLYFYQENDGKITHELSGIKSPRIVKWAPNGELLALTGDLGNQSGIWVYDPESGKVTRIWSESTSFDWSPDNRRMVITPRATEQTGWKNSPVTIDLTPIAF